MELRGVTLPKLAMHTFSGSTVLWGITALPASSHASLPSARGIRACSEKVQSTKQDENVLDIVINSI